AVRPARRMRRGNAAGRGSPGPPWPYERIDGLLACPEQARQPGPRRPGPPEAMGRRYRLLRRPERGGEGLEVVVVLLPAPVRRAPVDGVAVALVGDEAPVDHVHPPAAGGVGELPVGRGLPVVHFLDLDALVPGEPVPH